MTQTITRQGRSILWRHKKLYGLILMFLMAGIGLQAQNINWNASMHPTYAEDLNEGSSEPTDLYFYFEVEGAAISNGKLVVTLPYGNEGFDLTKFPIEKLAGSADLGTPTVSNNVLTFSGINLSQGATVWYRIPRYLKTQFNGIRSSNKLTIQVFKNSSTIATNGTKNDIGYNYRYATLLVVDPAVLPSNQIAGLQMNFGDNNGAKIPTPTPQNFQFGVQCTGGQVDSLTLSLKFMYGGVDLTNWKVAGQAIPANQISSSYMNGTTILDEVTYTIKIKKTDIPGSKGLKDAVILPISVEVVKNNCGGLNINYSTVWAEQPNIKSQYTSTNSGSFNSNPGDGKQPILKGFAPVWNKPAGELLCQNGDAEVFTLSITNIGAGKARNIRMQASTGNYSYVDTAMIRVRIGQNGTPVKPKKINVITYHSGIYVDPVYWGCPTLVSVDLSQNLSANATDTLYIDYVLRCRADLRVPIPGTNFQEGSVYVYINDLRYRYTDDCASQTYNINQGNTYPTGSVYGYGITGFDSGISLAENSAKIYSNTLRVDPFAINRVTSDNAKAVAKIKLPKGLAISGGASDIKVYRENYASSPWPVENFQIDNVSDSDSTIYSFELVNSTRKGINDIKTTTSFIVDIKITNTCTPAENVSGKFKISYEFYPTGIKGGGNCADVVYNVVQIYPVFSRQCVKEHVTYNFDFQRTSIIGLKDLGDDQKPDGTAKAVASDGIDLKQVMVNDTVQLTWDAKVLENGNKYLYAVLLSELNYDRFSIMEGGEPLTLILNNGSGLLKAIPKNTVRSGNILSSYDNGMAVVAERFAYVWEISKTDGTAFSENDIVTIVVRSTATVSSAMAVSNQGKRNVKSWLYATESALADIPAILSPGTARKGIEEYPVTYIYQSPGINSGGGAPTYYLFSGPQNVVFFENYSFYSIDFVTPSFSPKEFRHLSTLDSIVIEVPEGYILPDALPFYLRTVNNITGGIINSATRTINASAEGNLPNRKTFVFGKNIFDVDGTDPSKLPLPDGYYAILPQNFLLTATSAAVSGNAITTVYSDNHTYTQANVPWLGNLLSGVNSQYANQRITPLQYVDIGSLKVVSPGATIKPALASEITYDITLQNTKTDGDAHSAWLYVQGPVENVKLKIGAIEYVGEEQGGRWIKLPVVPMNTPINGVLTVNYTGSSDCSDQKATVYTLFDRTKTAQGQWTPVDATIAMTDAGFIAAQKDITTLQYIGAPLKLTIQNVDSRISGSVTALLTTPANPTLPSGATYNREDVNVGTEFPVEVVFNTQGAQGMVVKDSVELTIPGGLQYIANSAYFEVGGVNTAITNADILTKLATLNGTPGTKTIKLGMGTLPGNSLAYLRLKLVSTCDIDITKAEQIKAVFTGKQACGPDAKGNGYQSLSSFLMLSGTVPSYLAAVTLNSTLAQMSCKTGENTQSLTFTFKKMNLPASSVDGSDSIRIVLPKAVNLSGTVAYTYPASGSVTGGSGTLTPKNYIEGESRILSWAQPKAYYDELAANLAAASVTCTYNLEVVFVKSLATSPVPTGQILGGAMASTKAAASCPSIPGFIATAVKAVKIFATPIVDQPTNKEVCSGGSVAQTDFSGNFTDAGYGYSWAVTSATTGASIGMSAESGTGNFIPAFVSTGSGVVTVTLTPIYGDCSGTAKTFTITVNPKPTFTVTPVVICSGSSYTLSSAVSAVSSGATVEYYTANDGTGELSGPALTVSPTITTTYYARATVTATGCVGEFVAIVLTVNPLPEFTLSKTSESICATGASVDLSTLIATGPTNGGVMNYYSNSACTTAATNPVTTSGTYYLRAENTTTGCKSTAQSVSISLKTPTSISVQPTGGATCSGTNLTMSVTAAGEGSLSYQWKKDGIAISGATSSTYATSTPGSYAVEVTGGCGLLASNAAVITAKAATTITTQPAATKTVCAGVSSTISVSATAEGTPTYQWYDAGGAISGATSSSYTPTSSGTYYVIVTGGCGTATSTNSLVMIDPLPVPTITGASSAAQSQSGVIYSTETGKSSYVWTITGGTITSGQNTSSITVTWGTGASGNLTVTYQSNGCSPVSPTGKTVTLSSQSVPVITLGSSNVCLNDISTYSTESSKFNYAWTVVGGTIQSGQGTSSVSVRWDGSGASSVKVAYRHGSDTGLPLVDATESVTRKAATVITTAPVGGTVCFGGSHAMSVVATCEGPASYVWKKDGSVVGGNSANYTATASGSYTVEVTAGCGTATSAAATVTVKTQPAATLSGLTAVVTSQQVVYTAGAGSNYTWSVTGGTITSGGTTADNTATVTWGPAGSCTVSVNYTATDGCPTTVATTNVTISTQGTPTLVTPATSICYNTAQAYTTQSGKFNYLWTVTGGAITSGQGTASATITWGTAGSGTIKVAYSEVSAAATIASAITNVTINNKPTIGTISSPAGVCHGAALSLTSPTVTSTPSVTTKGWKLNNAAFTSGTTVTFAQHGQSLVYEAANACGTTTSNATTITVYQLPTVTTTAQSICPTTSIDLVTTVTNPLNHSLSFYTVATGGTALSSSTVTPITTTTYYVESTNTNNCMSATRTPVTITLKTVTAITVQPVAPSVVGIGNPFTLTVTAVGDNLTYQWYKNGSAIALGTNATAQSANYSVISTTAADYGNYHVVVTGDCGAAQTSNMVTVNVLSPDATLKDLLVNGVSVPGFDPQITDYTYYADCNVSLANIVGITNHSGAQVTNWMNQPLSVGDNRYTLTVTAENGFTTKTYSINIVRDCYVPRILKDLEDAVICEGETHTFEIEVEGQGLTYEWYYGNNRIMGANTNSLTISDAVLGDYERYQVVIRSNYNGFKSSAFSQKVRLWVADQLPTHLRFSEYPNPAITGNTYHIKVDGYTDVTKYTWSYDREGLTFSPGADLKWGNEAWVTFGTLSAGNGILKVTMEHPCGTRELTLPITVKYPTGTDDITATVVQVYPNPTSGILKVSGTDMNQQIRVLDVTGSLKGTYKTMEGTTMIDLTGYAKGTYMVQYNGKTYKIIKK